MPAPRRQLGSPARPGATSPSSTSTRRWRWRRSSFNCVGHSRSRGSRPETSKIGGCDSFGTQLGSAGPVLQSRSLTSRPWLIGVAVLIVTAGITAPFFFVTRLVEQFRRQGGEIPHALEHRVSRVAQDAKRSARADLAICEKHPDYRAHTPLAPPDPASPSRLWQQPSPRI